MRYEGLLLWAYEYALNHHFGNDIHRMAKEVQLPEDRLRKAMRDETSAESMCLFEALMGYFHEHGLSMDAVLALYIIEKGQ